MKKIALLLALCVITLNAVAAGEASGSSYEIRVPSAPRFVPSKVWDDGRFTYIELQKPYHGEIPIVRAVGDDGSREMVNFQWDEQNSRFVVLRLVDKAELVLGEKKVFINRL